MKIVLEIIMNRWQAYYDGARDNFESGTSPYEALEKLLKNSSHTKSTISDLKSCLLYTCPICNRKFQTGSDDCQSCGFKNTG